MRKIVDKFSDDWKALCGVLLNLMNWISVQIPFLQLSSVQRNKFVINIYKELWPNEFGCSHVVNPMFTLDLLQHTLLLIKVMHFKVQNDSTGCSRLINSLNSIENWIFEDEHMSQGWCTIDYKRKPFSCIAQLSNKYFMNEDLFFISILIMIKLHPIEIFERKCKEIEFLFYAGCDVETKTTQQISKGEILSMGIFRELIEWNWN